MSSVVNHSMSKSVFSAEKNNSRLFIVLPLLLTVYQ